MPNDPVLRIIALRLQGMPKNERYSDADAVHNRTQTIALRSSIDPTFLQAPLYPQSDVDRNQLPEFGNIFALEVEIIASGRFHDVLIESKVSLRRLLHTWVLAREASNEDGIVAVGVELGVQCTLREDRHLVRRKRVVDRSSPVLERELCLQGTLDHEVDLRAAWVGVWRVEAARAEKTKGHGCTGANKGRERLAIGANGATTFAFGQGVCGRSVEVELERCILRDELDAVHGFGSQQ